MLFAFLTFFYKCTIDFKIASVLCVEHIYMKLLTDRFPFVAVSIAFAVNKEVSKKKRRL